MIAIPVELKDCTILIVDDNELNVEQLRQVLEDEGFANVHATLDSREVEGLVPELNPDLILLDLHMPHKDGYEILEWLRDQHKASPQIMPVIVLTADATEDARIRALALGTQNFLTKPFDHLDVLLHTVNNLQARQYFLQIRDQNSILDAKVRERTKELEDALQQIREAQTQIVAQARLQAMGQMASGIAHDFNNSIAVIMGHAEIYRTFPELIHDHAELNKSFEIIGHAAEDAAAIVKRLRGFYQPDGARDESEKEGAELAKTAGDAIEMTKPKWRDQARAEGRQIEIAVELSEVRVALGPSDVREILTNLIFNAADAMPTGGTITVRTRTEGNFGVLEVEDTGSGMTEEVRIRCLESFFTTKGDKGTGLGLGMVRAIVQERGGNIAIRSTSGEGTTFTICLPLLKNPTGVKDDMETGLDRSLHVLVVDDEEKVREITVRMLQQDGHTTQEAVDGKDGSAKFLAGCFDLIVTDLAMPHVDGRRFAQFVHNRAPDVPVIMFTGFGDAMKADADKPDGVTLLLNKPCGPAEFRKALKEIFAPSDAPATAP